MVFQITALRVGEAFRTFGGYVANVSKEPLLSGLRTGVKQAVRFTMVAKSMVSVALWGEP